MEIRILIGTMTGTAELVAQEIELQCADDDTRIELQMMDGLSADAFEHDALFLICTSTYGQGDVPDNAKGFIDALRRERPDLSRVRYGVLGLGDRTYADTFNFGGKQFDDLLSELGATRIGDRATLDASGGDLPEDLGVAWMGRWLEAARAAHQPA